MHLRTVLIKATMTLGLFPLKDFLVSCSAQHLAYCFSTTKFLRATAVPAVNAERVLAMGILSVRLSVWGDTTRYRIKPRSDRDTKFSPW